MKKKSVINLEALSKPRNHVLLAMSKRNGSGTHEKSKKAIRQQEKIALKKHF